MDAKLKSEMENRLSHLSDYVEGIRNNLSTNHLEEVEYYLEIMEDEVKAFLKNVINAFEMEE